MARKFEFIKRNEARIIIYLITAALPLRNGKMISEKLSIDYAYVMKLMDDMYNKGWIHTHKYNLTTYYRTGNITPIKEAKGKLMEEQTKLGHNDNR